MGGVAPAPSRVAVKLAGTVGQLVKVASIDEAALEKGVVFSGRTANGEL